MSYKDEILSIATQIKEIESTIESSDVDHKRSSRDAQRQIDALRQQKKEALINAGKKATAEHPIKPGDLVELKSGGLRGCVADLGARETEHSTIQVLAKVIRWVEDNDEDGDTSQLQEVIVAADCLKKIT